VRNAVNLGCGGAWTQGALLADAGLGRSAQQRRLVSERAMDAMLDAADKHGLDVVSPSLAEGELDYDFEAHAAAFVKAMAGTLRRTGSTASASRCARRCSNRSASSTRIAASAAAKTSNTSVRCQRNGVPVGTVGDALLHHFGSITQKAIKLETGQKDLGDRDYFYAKLGMGWLARKQFKATRKRLARSWLAQETAAAGYVMHMLRSGGRWVPADYL
jgi:hypothetical protein